MWSVIVFAFAGPNMSTDGWQVQVTAFLDHAASQTRRGLAWLPGWVSALTVLGALVLVIAVCSILAVTLSVNPRSTLAVASTSPP